MEMQDIISIIGLTTGVAGLSFGLYQYYIGQKWKRSELAAELLEKFAYDEKIVTCCQVLDWSVRRISIPEDFYPVVDECSQNDTLHKKRTFVHSYEELHKALLPEQVKGEFTMQQMIYRDLFDHLFTYLERINHYININLISISDVSGLEYWMRELSNPRFTDQPVFTSFIDTYEYDGVKELMVKFGIDPGPREFLPS
jgi:hypothetical protein